MSSIAELSKEIHENARNKGFWDKERNTGEMLMLVVSELSEALEADRIDHLADTSYINEMEAGGYTWENSKLSFETAFKKSVKNSFEDELADAMIRIMDLAHSRGIDLEWHIRQKMNYNATRQHMHGKKY